MNNLFDFRYNFLDIYRDDSPNFHRQGFGLFHITNDLVTNYVLDFIIIRKKKNKDKKE